MGCIVSVTTRQRQIADTSCLTYCFDLKKTLASTLTFLFTKCDQKYVQTYVNARGATKRRQYRRFHRDLLVVLPRLDDDVFGERTAHLTVAGLLVGVQNHSISDLHVRVCVCENHSMHVRETAH